MEGKCDHSKVQVLDYSKKDWLFRTKCLLCGEIETTDPEILKKQWSKKPTWMSEEEFQGTYKEEVRDGKVVAL